MLAAARSSIRFRLIRGVVETAGGEQAERAADRRERRAQLVTDHRDEFVLHALDFFSLADVARDDLHASVLEHRRANLDRHAAVVRTRHPELTGGDVAIAKHRAAPDRRYPE